MKDYFLSILLGCFLSLSAFAQINTKIEAESSSITGTFEVKNNDNASEGTFIVLKENSTLTFQVDNVSTSGSYKLQIYHFNGGTTQDISLEVNGTSTTITLQASNWAYQGAAKSTTLDVNLNAGNNTLKFIRSNVSVSLDYFKVTQEGIDNPNPLPSDVYYVSNSGDDSNDGLSENTPWKSLDRVSGALASNANGGWILPGNKILFKRGDSFYGQLLVNRSGTSDDLIEISSYGNENDELPIISGSGGDISGGDYFQAITLTNSSNLLLSKIWVKNDRRDGSRYSYGEHSSFGIKVVANQWGGITRNLTFKNLKVSDVFGISIPPPSEFNSLKATGIRFESEENEPTNEVTVKDIVIEDSYFTNIGKAGVWAIHKGLTDDNDDTINRNQNFTIRNNTFYQTGGSGVILSKTMNALVENNDFDQTGHSNESESRLAGRGSGMWVWSCRNVIAQYNRSYSVRGPNDSYGMHIDFGNKNIIFQYNYSEDSAGGFVEILGDNVNSIYRFNVSVNDGIRDFHGSTLWVSDFAGSEKPRIKSDNNYIYNNTIYLGKNQKPDISIVAKNTYVYNNVFVVTEGVIGEHVDITIESGSQLYVSNNLFQGNIASSFKILDSNSQSGDPLFVNEGDLNKESYDIKEGSPVINNGKFFPQPSFPTAGLGVFKDITHYPTKDFFGNPIDLETKKPNIGASNAYNSTLEVTSFNKENIFFTVFPNPVKENLNVKLKKEISRAKITVYDVQGKKMYSILKDLKLGNSMLKLPRSIKNGIYFLQIDNENESQTTQFILYR